MTPPRIRALVVAVLAGLTLLPFVASRMTAPANYGAHGLTTGFGRGRLDLPGIVSEGSGGSIDLPDEALKLRVRLSGDGPIHLRGRGVDQTIVGSDAPTDVSLDLNEGGRLSIESAARIRLHELAIERAQRPTNVVLVLVVLGIGGVALAIRGTKRALASVAALILLASALGWGSLSETFARIAFAQLVPAAVALALLLPLVLALRHARFFSSSPWSPLALTGFALSLVLATVQLTMFEQPLPMGDPAAYLEMGGKFADGLSRLGSPLGLGPILTDLQPYLALPATGLLYGVLRLIGGLSVIYAAQALAMAVAVFALVSISETEISPRAARIALVIALLHPSFSVLPGIVQPEPFILAAWTLAALLALRALREDGDPRPIRGAGILLGLGLALHPQGLSFLLLALVLCLLPWAPRLVLRPAFVIAAMFGAVSVLLPVAAAERFSKPLAYVLDRQYGFFAYTSPHPLGFWLYLDSDGWQGPLRIEDTTYQKELIAMKGESATTSSFADVASFVARHPGPSIQTLLTNLHRLWNQPDNPFAVSYPLPYELQIPFHRVLVVMFVLSLPLLLGGRLALVALPFVMLSMTYPAYHVFNKYATPALPFLVIGSAAAIERWLNEGRRFNLMSGGLTLAALGAFLPATFFARLGVPGDAFMIAVRAALWVGLALALGRAVRQWGSDGRARTLSAAIGALVLLGGSFASSRTGTTRGTWFWTLDQPFSATCHVPASRIEDGEAWLFVDTQSADGRAPRIEVNGRVLDAAVPTMPRFGLASFRGRRDPASFRQMWRTRIDEPLLDSGELRIRVSGDETERIFGDIREGGEGPRLSLGDWPYLSVYRLMHEGQYRLPTLTAPPQACVSPQLSGRPGIALARIPAGEEGQIALKSAKPLRWIF